jgi:transcriptional regulator with XRE-family HTH domain
MNTKAIGKKLVELRGNRTQSEVSSALGISLSALGMYERGERIPRDEVKIAIAKFYDVTVQSIFFEEEDTNRVKDE